jgi:transposase
MNRVAVYVGLDYHQASVQVCVMDQEGEVLLNRRCANLWWEIADQANACGQVRGAAIESCTGAADLADELVTQAGWTVNLAHPGFVHRMKQNPDKTDYSDARMLADLERVGYLPKVWLAPREVRDLRTVVRYRDQLAQERRNLKLRVGAILRQQRVRYCNGKSWTKRWEAWLEQVKDLSPEGRWVIDRQLKRMKAIVAEIEEVQAHLAELTADDPMVAALVQMPGIGLVTAWTIRAEIGRFDRFRSGKQLARFCALTPCNASSGERQADAGLVKAGNRMLRTVLIEAAHRLIRFDDEWKSFATELLLRGKPKCVVVAATANRWVRRLYHDLQPSQLVA